MNLFQDLESKLSSSETKLIDSKENLNQCESKLEEKSKAGIPDYGPTRGDRCLSSRDDDTGKYTLQFSTESQNLVEAECSSKSGRRYII